MKRLLVIAALVLSCVCARAKGVGIHPGILAGTTSDWIGSTSSGSSICGWHAGAALEIKLPMYFAIQPGVQYEMGRSNVMINAVDELDNPGLLLGRDEFRMHTISVPVALQWGPDLGVIRPFAQIVPIFNFNIGGDYRVDGQWLSAKKYVNDFQFGLGLGLGLDVWKIQLGLRYNWMFGDWRKCPEYSPFVNNSAEMTGLTFSAGFFF